MSDHERGAYTPPHADAPLSFDPRQPVRGARPIPLTLILSVLVLAALVAAILWFYQSGVRQAGQAPQTVGAPVAGIKEAAKADAQPQDPAAGLQIYRSDEASGGQMQTLPAEPTFAPPPETPQARPTTPIVVAQAPPAKPAPAQPAPKAVAPPPAATQAALKPPIPATPVAKPALPPAQKVAATPPPPEKKAPAPEPKAAASGGARVQIGAVSSTAIADKAWKEAVAAAPGLAAGKGKAVEKIEGGSLYRTFVTGFGSRADAQAFCAKLQSAGKSCFVR
jgi:outer membrane biosynthesis protein TonB